MSDGTRRVTRNVALLPGHEKALRWLTAEAGDTNVSATFRRLLEKEMRERFGADWLTIIEVDRSELRQEVSAA